jgi:hypothetical protein
MKEIDHALDNFRNSFDSVASGFQPPRGRRFDSLATGSGAGGAGY